MTEARDAFEDLVGRCGIRPGVANVPAGECWWPPACSKWS